MPPLMYYDGHPSFRPSRMSRCQSSQPCAALNANAAHLVIAFDTLRDRCRYTVLQILDHEVMTVALSPMIGVPPRIWSLGDNAVKRQPFVDARLHWQRTFSSRPIANASRIPEHFLAATPASTSERWLRMKRYPSLTCLLYSEGCLGKHDPWIVCTHRSRPSSTAVASCICVMNRRRSFNRRRAA